METGITLSQCSLRVAGITIQFTADDNVELAVIGSHRKFIVNGDEPDFRLRVHYGALPSPRLEEKLFDSGSFWSVYRSNGGYEITFTSESVAPDLYQVAVIDSDFISGDLYIKQFKDTGSTTNTANAECVHRSYIIPIMHPLLMGNLLSRGRGIEIHACGVSNNGQGLIFTGESGSGKSTLGSLWQNEKDALVLSDERIIIRRIDGQFYMYGTPWYSSARASSPEGVPLKAIFHVKHSPENNASRISAIDTASRLFVRCYPTFWDEEGLTYTLDLIGQIAETVPCYELGFVPEKSVLDFIKNMNSGETSS